MATITIPQSRAATRTDLRVAGLLLFLLAAQFVTVITLAAGMAPGYDLQGGAISDLGTLPETAALFNLSLVAVGVLNVAGGLLLFRAADRGWIIPVFAVAGLGAAGAGLFPLNASELHGLFALVAFLFFNIEAIACASLVSGPMRWVSVLAGLIGLVFVAVMIIGDGGNPAIFGAIGHGGAERMIVYPAMLWMLAFGGCLMGTREEVAGR